MKTKICCACKKRKETGQFFFQKQRNRYHSYCKVCLYECQKKRWIDRKIKAIDLFGGRCTKCGYNKNYSALEFHHVDAAQKEFAWNKLRQMAWESVIIELSKCILICANCHREHHNPQLFKTRLNLETTIPILAGIQSTGQCEICEGLVYGTKFCSHICAAEHRRKVKIRPDAEELKGLIASCSWVELGRKYNVSDNAVRKWARQYGLI